MKTFTLAERDRWRRYERVRKSGTYNMVTDSTKAAAAANLTRDQYWLCVTNYSALEKAVAKVDESMKKGKQ